MIFFRYFIFLTILFGSQQAFASSLTISANCVNPHGRILGVGGVLMEHQHINDVDGVSDAKISLIWTEGEDRALYEFTDSNGIVTRERPIKISQTNEQTTFLQIYASSVWMYSLFHERNVLIMSQHTNGVSFDSEGAVGKLLQSRCSVRID